MTLPNHIAGGVVVTSVFSAIIGVNVLADYRLVSAVIVASMLPDIDHPSTLIGRLFGPLSKFVNNKFGHRTFTHSFLFILIMSLLVSLVNSVVSVPGLVFVFTLGLFVHVTLDMMTISGVEFLYPFSKTLYVMPEKPELRFSTNNRTTEMALFGFFLFAGTLMWPLMKNGFWTSYNRTFGSMKHLYSEFQRSDDLLFAEFTIRNGSSTYDTSAYVLDATNSKIVAYIDGNQFEIPSGREKVLSVLPSHTGIEFQYKESKLDSSEFANYDKAKVIEVEQMENQFKLLEVIADIN